MKLADPTANYTCKLACQLYPQESQNPEMGCCDGVWTPYLSFPTLKYLSQDRVPRMGINVRPDTDAVGFYGAR